MRYWGGKTTIAKFVTKQLAPLAEGTEGYWEPFAGGLAIAAAFPYAGPRLLSDINPALETLYSAWNAGWRPPVQDLTREQWHAYKAMQDVSDPMTAFVGHGCSYAGKWFGGYAKVHPKSDPGDFAAGYESYVQRTIRGLEKKFAALRRGGPFRFATLDAFAVEIPTDRRLLVYCDPPYADAVSGYVEGADGDFWKWAEEVATHHTVAVSEYDCPLDWKRIEAPRRADRTYGTRPECVFVSND